MAQLPAENSTWLRAVRCAAHEGRLSHAVILTGSGDLLPSATYRSEDGFGLGDWVRRMRTARAENDPKLTEDRIRRLDAIGMKW